MFEKFVLGNIKPEELLTHLGKLLDTMDFQRLRTSCDTRQNALIVNIDEDEEMAGKIISKIKNVIKLVDVGSPKKNPQKPQRISTKKKVKSNKRKSR